ncbi:hypothetical protein BGZ73_003276 [Actinomortierella ambigua]|nr:hypothetical protein BGZ73_003276 [Actinomortierella ambigua]
MYLAYVAVARYDIEVANNGATKTFRFSIAYDEGRICICINNTQTESIRGVGAGFIKMFAASLDCNGDFDNATAFQTIMGAHKYASFSFGADGPSSTGPYGHCPNWYST